MHILFIAPRFPYPPMQGDRLRAYELLRYLHPRHTITLITPYAPQAKEYATQLCQRWIPINIPRWQAYLHALAALPTTQPLQVALLCPPALINHVQQFLKTEAVDLVHIHTARVAPVLKQSRIPWVVDFIDALSLNMARRAEHQGGPLGWLFQAEAVRMAHYEARLLKACQGASVVASADFQALHADPKLRIIPMGVDLQRFQYQQPQTGNPRFIFSGRMAYFPNADAAQFLATEVFPIIRRHYPMAELRIVGADPPPQVQQLAKLAGVHVTGYVPDMATELHQASVALAPLRAGTGQQIKVLEAMACGTPVVATPRAIAGVAAENQKHVLVAETPEGLAYAAIRLLEEPAFAIQLSQAARTMIELRYTWEYVGQAFEELYTTAQQRTAAFA